jgi:hypothetical protein
VESAAPVHLGNEKNKRNTATGATVPPFSRIALDEVLREHSQPLRQGTARRYAGGSRQCSYANFYSWVPAAGLLRIICRATPSGLAAAASIIIAVQNTVVFVARIVAVPCPMNPVARFWVAPAS